jgi:BlaI family transcriptional regulator, penicillinase repressor
VVKLGQESGAMSRKTQDVTDAELAIMQVLWSEGESTVRSLTEHVYPSVTGSDIATVQKLLKRLETKGHVLRQASVWPHLYAATTDRMELIGRRLQSTADDLCGGSLIPLLSQLVKIKPLTDAEQAELRQLLESLDAPAGSSV